MNQVDSISVGRSIFLSPLPRIIREKDSAMIVDLAANDLGEGVRGRGPRHDGQSERNRRFEMTRRARQ